jgi:ribosome-associated heat shock protein Hsp15
MARMLGISEEPVRVDKWLWAARFFKTRGLASEAVDGGHVEVNGKRVKPSKDVRPGDALEIVKGPLRFSVVVRGTAERRGPASLAVQLYEETPESRTARERAAEERRYAGPPPGADRTARPTKRDRRRLEAARGRRGA